MSFLKIITCKPVKIINMAVKIINAYSFSVPGIPPILTPEKPVKNQGVKKSHL
ncbi:MAG: hypothetical protein ACJARD_001710 [Alphaproteobacteria bacterium]